MVKNNKYLFLSFLLLLSIAIAGCSSGEVPASEDPVKTEHVTQPPTKAPTATIQEKAAEEPEETEEPDDYTSDDAILSEGTGACVECHTDQAMLIDTADPVEEVESENEGAG
jgi:hypothetical protein